MRSSFTYEVFSALKGMDARSMDGEKIGTVKEIFYDETSRDPKWIGLGIGFLRRKQVVVPLEGVTFERDTMIVHYPKDLVTNGPDFDEHDGVLTPDAERRLCHYFGVIRHRAVPHRLNRYNFSI